MSLYEGYLQNNWSINLNEFTNQWNIEKLIITSFVCNQSSRERERQRERESLCIVIILHVLHSTYNFILICNNLQTFENIKVMNYKNFAYFKHSTRMI